MCCSVLQCVTMLNMEVEGGSMLRVNLHEFQCVTVCCSVLQCGIMYCSVLQCVVV